jgi:phosphatidylethanolamine/phosphatidyl-N-methylethanolamine N-methyltransferase
MSNDMDKESVQQIYRRWAPVYDLVFGAVFDSGRREVAAASERIGGRVLEVGVGTGISLPYYSDRTRVVGIDLSEEMLARARQRVTDLQLRNVEKLMVMDAERLDFPDASFDVVVAVCVVNTVPHPEVALDEFARVLRAGGEIVLLNRIGADAGLRRMLERFSQPVASRLGWRSDFPWERFTRWAAGSRYEMQLRERRPMPPLGHFSVIRFEKIAARNRAEQVGAVFDGIYSS